MAAGNIDILLVEDNPGDTRLIQEMLKEGMPAGHGADAEERLDAAISRVRERRFDIIILDLNLPDSTGLETLDRMTAATGGLVPVIVLTGLSDEAIGESTIIHGAEDYLVKGTVNPYQLARSMRYAMGRKKMELVIRESERRLKEAQAAARLGDWEFDLAAQTITWSDQMYRMYERDPALGPPSLKEEADYYTPEQAALLRQTAQQVIDTGSNADYEFAAMLKSGKTPVFDGSMRPIKDASGRVIKILGTVHDITERKRVEQALQEKETMYRMLFEQARDSILMLELPQDGPPIILEANTAAKRILGYSRDELIGKPISILDTVEDIAPLITERRRMSEAAEGAIFEARHRRKDGSTFDVEVSAKEMVIGGKRLSLAIERDITERKRAEKALIDSEERYRMLFNASADGILIADIETKTLNYANPAMCRMLGYTEEELKTLNIADIHPREDLQRIINDFEAQARGDITLGVDIPCLMKDRTIFYADVNTGLIMIDGRPRMVGFFRDITERKRAEKELLRYGEHMEELVQARTADLENANREIDSFSYTVSHDLRAPLRHINGFLEMFRSEMGDIVNEKARHYMDVIGDAAVRMGQLIDDLLSFSRMGRTELKFKQVEMENLADEALKEFSQEIAAHAITVSRKPLPSVQGDNAMLRVVLTNFISNAVKFTSKTDNPNIEIGCDTKDNEHIFHVRDNGAGFDMRYADKLFGVFQRLHSDKEFEGTGIGLATIKKIIQRHGGRVWAEGEVGQGTCFYFSLPAQKSGE